MIIKNKTTKNDKIKVSGLDSIYVREIRKNNDRIHMIQGLLFCLLLMFLIFMYMEISSISDKINELTNTNSKLFNETINILENQKIILIITTIFVTIFDCTIIAITTCIQKNIDLIDLLRKSDHSIANYIEKTNQNHKQ